MKKADITREKLLTAAHAAFGERGYSNVPLRDIAAAAGVDVALISRYFGSKRGLFAALLDVVFDWPELLEAGPDAAEVVIAKYAGSDPSPEKANVTRFVLLNAMDPEVGEMLREALQVKMFAPMLARMGGAAAPNLAMFTSVLLGMSMGRDCLRLPGMGDVPAPEFADQMRHLLDAAMSFDPSAQG